MFSTGNQLPSRKSLFMWCMHEFDEFGKVFLEEKAEALIVCHYHANACLSLNCSPDPAQILSNGSTNAACAPVVLTSKQGSCGALFCDSQERKNPGKKPEVGRKMCRQYRGTASSHGDPPV